MFCSGCGLLPCFRRGKTCGDRATDLNPVLLVSGIGGSILHAKKKKSWFELRVWVRIFLANLEFKKYLWSIYNPKTGKGLMLDTNFSLRTIHNGACQLNSSSSLREALHVMKCLEERTFVGYTESLDENIEIVVPEDDYGLYAIDILDPSLFAKLFHLTEVYHFHEMINMLLGCGYEKGTTLFGYGYDFRQSNRIDKAMDGLKVKLAAAYEASGGKKVNVISHSMGGLVMLSFLSLHHDVFAKYVNKWICIACPFQGAPGCINDAILTGLQFVYGFESYFFLSRWTMHQLLVECPSIYEMLPNPEFKWKQTPLILVWRKESEGSETPLVKLDEYGPTESIKLFEEALRNNEMKYDGKPVPLPFNYSILKWASRTRQVLDKAQLPDGINFYNIFGTSFDTPFDVCYGSETSPIDDSSQICHSMPHYSYVDGDGTVPAESAMADGFAAAARVGVRADHRGLLNDKEVFQLIKQWLGVSQKYQYANTSRVVDENMHAVGA